MLPKSPRESREGSALAAHHQTRGRAGAARLHRFAPRSEKHVDRLFNEAEQVADEDVAGGEDGVSSTCQHRLPAIESTTGKKRGRRPLPEHLPRERVEYDLADDHKACPCCHGQMHRMGRDRYRAASYRGEGEGSAECAVQICLPPLRTAPGSTRQSLIAPMPAQPLPGSIAKASTLAICTGPQIRRPARRYRLAQAFERAGVPVSQWRSGSTG